MSRKRKPQHRNRHSNDWGPWLVATEVVNRATGVPGPVPEGQTMVTNQKYNVFIRRMEPANEQTPPMVHLSICRLDRKPVRDWRDMQRIKNELVGPECEGVEIYPAESRLVDSANQYHIWVFADPTVRLPFGFNERLVMDYDAHDETGVVQRPLPAHYGR